MNILVLLKMVPDVVEDIEVAADGKSLDPDSLRLIPSESDEHALEEALILKERHAAKVTAIALDCEGADDALFTALAKGADRAVKIAGGATGLATRAGAARVARALSAGQGLQPMDLVLTGTQAIDDLEGLTAPLLAHRLGWPYLGIVTQVVVDPASGRSTVTKEYPGGCHGEFDVPLPAVLGVQAAEKPPRYVPVAKVRAAMKSLKIETVVPPEEDEPAPLDILQMAKPQAAGHAEMLDGAPEEVAGKLVEILAGRGLL